MSAGIFVRAGRPGRNIAASRLMLPRNGLYAVCVVALMIALSMAALGSISMLWPDDGASPQGSGSCNDNSVDRDSVIDELRRAKSRWM